MINLVLDSRETNLISCIRKRDLDKYTDCITIDTKSLDIGDVTINSNTKTWTFERKTVNDLLSSVKDGRYKEQKARLLSNCESITYIIEGDDILSTKNSRNQDLLSSIYMYTMYRDNIHLIFTRNTEDTATFVLTMCAKLVDNPQKFHMTLEPSNTSYIDCIKVKKMDNVTPDNCFIMQLSQIPTISKTIAKYIHEKYPTFREFISAIDESDNKIKLLCEIEKIGKEKANKILQFLHYNV
jgi:crossover junction endonuclease MUS81